MSKELTKQAIVVSFIKLLNDRQLDKISVKDIVEECGINRNTFYYHFTNIYELVEDIFETELNKVIEKNAEHFTWQDGILEASDFIMQNKRAVYHIYNSVNREYLLRYLYGVANHAVEGVIRRQAEGLRVADQDIRYITLFYKHATVGIAIEWVETGMKAEIEPVIHRMGEIFEGNIRHALERAAF